MVAIISVFGLRFIVVALAGAIAGAAEPIRIRF
jgi:hypothetical protein